MQLHSISESVVMREGNFVQGILMRLLEDGDFLLEDNPLSKLQHAKPNVSLEEQDNLNPFESPEDEKNSEMMVTDDDTDKLGMDETSMGIPDEREFEEKELI